ncbi:MAG: hypothetical protein PF440_10675 [Thiomicrorhabdus sp.]|jgi:hypothetical protein|nr:hypothetical protein [Thiomicrorhabdus sp.]
MNKLLDLIVAEAHQEYADNVRAKMRCSIEGSGAVETVEQAVKKGMANNAEDKTNK